jgi:hypothetical protein
VILNIRDSKLYISFSIGSKSLALLRHYVLSLRRRFYNVRGALGRVERLVVNYVNSLILSLLNKEPIYVILISNLENILVSF